MNRWLDCIQIWYGCFLGISDDLINFWDESIKNKMSATAIYKKNAHGGSGVHFFLIISWYWWTEPIDGYFFIQIWENVGKILIFFV